MANMRPPVIKNRYELQQQLGRGAMGVVYRAKDRLTQQTVALKQVLYDGYEQAGASETLEFILAHEFQTLASIRHPNIVSVLDYGFYDRHPYFTMNFIENPERIDFAADSRDLHGKIDLLFQLLQAMAYLHRRQVIHRDLKPANVLVDPNGIVKVLDFGLAMDANEKGMIAGTPAYMAPELFDGVRPSRASDLFSVGILAYTILTGWYPFPTRDEQTVIEAIQDDEPDFSSFPVLKSDLSSLTLKDVVCRLLAKFPPDRYSHAEAAIEDLSLVLGQPLPKENAAIRDSFLHAARFIGRRQELRQLDEARFRAVAGKGSAWLLGGESGVGKSRLLQELRTYALVQSMDVFQITGIEGKPDTMQVWQHTVRELLVTSLVQLSPQDIRILSNLIPDIDRLLGLEMPEPVPLSAEEQHRALVAIITGLLRQNTQPTLLIVDDAHWLGIGLEPIQRLVRDVENLSLLIVISYRSDEYPDFPKRLPPLPHIQLERLRQNEIVELSASMIGETARKPEVLELLQREANGNAFFLVEVMRALAEEAGHLQKVGTDTLPSVVFEGKLERLIERRFQQLPHWAVDGLRIAAVMGRDLDLKVLNHILQPLLALVQGDDISVTISSIWRGNRGVSLDDWLLVCADAAVLEVADNQWRFAHDKFREYLLATTTEVRRGMINNQIAKATTAVYPG